MTVAELIAELQKYPSTMRVVVPGYEHGLDDAAPVGVVKATLDANVDETNDSGKRAWYAGKHAVEDDGDFDAATAIEVLLIGSLHQ